MIKKIVLKFIIFYYIKIKIYKYHSIEYLSFIKPEILLLFFTFEIPFFYWRHFMIDVYGLQAGPT